ncbi:MAG: hypothetical protein DRI74_08750 [Bacteroidetes bacterium]|nr:MAG: hypothetical protein DRI74_08750 [Bacteroidota bacterium]
MDFTFDSIKKNKNFLIKEDDKALIKYMMLYEGECVIGVKKALEKYNYTEQHYYQLLRLYNEKGFEGLVNKKRRAKKNNVRTKEVENQIIRIRYLDPFTSAEVIAQKLNQTGHKVSIRSIERTITEYGLQKKLMSSAQKMKRANKKLKLKHQEKKQK